MKKLYEKNEVNFALAWIAIYVGVMLISDNISQVIGVEKILTAPLNIALVIIMYRWIRNNGLLEKYGFCKVEGSAKKYLYFIPFVLLSTTNVWYGVHLNTSVTESILCVISMLCVGFLEEVIFRGFLFKAMCKTNVKTAILVASLTFGIGHITNVLRGEEILGTLWQMVYAVAIGYVFTIFVYKGKSIWPCIISHSVIDCLSIFANSEGVSVAQDLSGGIFICIISIAYALYLLATTDKMKSQGLKKAVNQ